MVRPRGRRADRNKTNQRWCTGFWCGGAPPAKLKLVTMVGGGGAQSVSSRGSLRRSVVALAIGGDAAGAVYSGYQRGPWTTNGPSPVCTSSALHARPTRAPLGTPSNAKPVQGQATGTEYAYLADAFTAHECVQRCCSDWSCWGFTFHPVGSRLPLAVPPGGNAPRECTRRAGHVPGATEGDSTAPRLSRYSARGPALLGGCAKSAC